MFSPYGFIALFQHTGFVVLLHNRADKADASQRVNVPFPSFFAHSPKKSLSLSKLRSSDSLADFSVGGSFLFGLSGERLDLHRALVHLPDSTPTVADWARAGRVAYLLR